jgi:hypothetical protein
MNEEEKTFLSAVDSVGARRKKKKLRMIFSLIIRAALQTFPSTIIK